jgi:hypothetical protein
MTRDEAMKVATYAPPGLEYASVDQNEQWLLRFADQDCGDQWFGGDGYTPEEARELAIDAWNRYAPAWSVRLMRTVTLDEVRAGGATVIQQAFAEREVGMIEALKPFAHYYRLNDCEGRPDDDAIEVPIGDLRFAALALAAKGDSRG